MRSPGRSAPSRLRSGVLVDRGQPRVRRLEQRQAFGIWDCSGRLHVKQVAVQRLSAGSTCSRVGVRDGHPGTVAGSTAAPDQLAQPVVPGRTSVTSSDGGVNNGPTDPRWLHRHRSDLRGESAGRRPSHLDTRTRRARRNRLGRDACSPGTSEGGTGFSSIGQIGFRSRDERVDVALLGNLRERLDASPVPGDASSSARGIA